MNYEQFPDKQRFAVKFHVGSPIAPDGWPSEANPLGYDRDPPDGYVLRTGAELNKLRAKMHTQYVAVCDGIEKEHHRRRLRRETDTETAATIADGFEWRGKRFSCSLAAQQNCAHDATADASEFPVTRSTVDHEIVSLSQKEFADFYRAMRAHIRDQLATGQKRGPP